MKCAGDYRDVWVTVGLERGQAVDVNPPDYFESRVDSSGRPTDEFSYVNDDGNVAVFSLIPQDNYRCEACGAEFISWADIEWHWEPESTKEEAACPHTDWDDYFERCGDCGYSR